MWKNAKKLFTIIVTESLLQTEEKEKDYVNL